MKRLGLFSFFIFFTAAGALANEATDFDSLWKGISEKSHALLAEKSEFEASEIGASRAGRHWAPRLLLNAEAVSTNAPSTTLFSTLDSRSLLATDLSPGLMNNPSRQWFKRGGVTLDWALFEGGSRTAVSSGATLESQSRALALQAQQNEEYSRLAQDYAKLLALRSEVKAYLGLKEKLQSFLARYKLGSKDNPVGYSGLLGMRALLNRLESYLEQSSAEIFSIERSIQVRSGRGEQPIQTAETLSSPAFIDSKLTTRKNDPNRSSLSAESMRLSADARAEYAKAERARWLPKVGVFASGNLTSAPRDSGTSTEYGAYLQWELFSAGNIGAYRESLLRATSAKEKASEMTQRSKIMKESLAQSVPILRENLKRAENSIELTDEQILVTEKLFKNGSINALQFVEVLSRRADVVQNRRQIEYAYVDSVAMEYLQNVSTP